MLSVKQGNYWYHFYNVFWYDAVLDLGLNPEPPALDVSTLPLAIEEAVRLLLKLNVFVFAYQRVIQNVHQAKTELSML